jgi:hypothetical protein
VTPDPTASMDDNLEMLRGLGRTLVWICLFLALAAPTLVVLHGTSESFHFRCARATDDEGADFRSVRPDARWFPPRLDCITTTDEGVRSVTTLPLSSYTVTVFAGLTAAWTAAAAFALAVAIRPARVRLLDRAAATWLVGVLTGVTLVQIVILIGRRYLDAAPAPLYGAARAAQPEWLFAWVVACVVAGATVAASRAQRIAGGWVAAVATALTVGVYLIFTTAIHPLRLSPTGAVATGLAAGAVAHAGRALIRLRNGRPDA